ncbi:MAG TPA: CHASE3 domain-containing protein [Candidatus Acidoferrum sp.]|jgi:signal transduction histidine kinase
MRSRKRARTAFASALILFVVSGIAATITIERFSQNQKWMFHTDDVDNAITRADTVVSIAARERTAYIGSGDPQSLEKYIAATRDIPVVLQHLKQLTADNPRQMALYLRLEEITARRMRLLENSVEQMQKAPIDEHAQLELSQQSAALSAEAASVVNAMRQAEDQLFQERRRTSQDLYFLLLAIMALTSVLAVVLFCVHYRLISRQVVDLEQTEKRAVDSQEASRRLSARLMVLQDEERRKFSRELHDSLGQYLAMVKMDLSRLSENRIVSGLLADPIKYLDQAIGETRTLSHLLHPPLLDEVGFASAATWYVEGFGQRSGIQVKVDVPEDLIRLPGPIELVLFRILQESLTNIHRHSNSARAECSVTVVNGQNAQNQVILKIRDYGKGVSREVLDGFRNTGENLGVGLAGMRERVRELDGALEIQSDGSGTTVIAILPFRAAATGVEAAGRLKTAPSAKGGSGSPDGV